MWAGPFEPQSIFGHLGGATGSQQKSFLHFHMVISCNCATLVCNHINKVKFASKLFHFYQNFYEIIIFGHNDLIFKRTTFQCGNQNNRTPRNLSSADFPRVRIKIFSVCQKSVPCKKWWWWIEMWKSEWNVWSKWLWWHPVIPFLTYALLVVWLLFFGLFIIPGKMRMSSSGARCEKSGWVK